MISCQSLLLSTTVLNDVTDTMFSCVACYIVNMYDYTLEQIARFWPFTNAVFYNAVLRS